MCSSDLVVPRQQTGLIFDVVPERNVGHVVQQGRDAEDAPLLLADALAGRRRVDRVLVCCLQQLLAHVQRPDRMLKARVHREAGLMAISQEKQRRFARAVHHWVGRNPWSMSRTLRCDAVIVVPMRLPYHIEDAFPLPM